MISKTISCIVRGAQVVFAIVIIGLTGDIISTSFWNQVPRGPGNPAQINFAMFIGAWTLLCELAFFPIIFWGDNTDEIYLYITLGLDSLSAVFCMCGGIALAAAMNIHSCADWSYTNGNSITQGSSNQERRCRDAQATTAFIWLDFILFGVTTMFSIRAVFLYNTDLGLPKRTSASRVNDSTAKETGGPMAAEETDQHREPGSHRFGFRREKMADGGPHAALDQEDLEDNRTYPPSGGPEAAED